MKAVAFHMLDPGSSNEVARLIKVDVCVVILEASQRGFQVRAHLGVNPCIQLAQRRTLGTTLVKKDSDAIAYLKRSL